MDALQMVLTGNPNLAQECYSISNVWIPEIWISRVKQLYMGLDHQEAIIAQIIYNFNF